MRHDRAQSHLWARAAVLASICLAVACATHRPLSLADRYVRHATKEDLEKDGDLGPPPDAADAAARIAASAALQTTDNSPRPLLSNFPVIEQEDLALKAALAAAAGTPSAETYRQVGIEYRRLHVFDVAYTYLHRALALRARDSVTFDELARLWRDSGLPQVALGDAHRAVSYGPRSAAAQNTLGTVLYALGELGAAEDAFARALALDPTAAYAESNLCYVAFLRGAMDEAEERCEQAIEQSPALAVAHNNLGLVHAAAGRLDRASQAFSRGGGVARGLYNTGIVHLARREYLAAAEAFDAALREEPTLFDAWRRAAEARALAAGAAPPLHARKEP